MVILIFINIAIIIYIFLKYYRFPENKNSTIEKIEDKDVMLIGYINDGEFHNSFDLILAEIVELNVKGYIKIEYSKEIIDKYNYIIKQNINIGSDKLNKYEMLVMNFLFFNKTEITRAELEEKLRNTFHSYNVQFNEIESVLNNQLVIEGIIDAGKQQELAKRKKWYVKISIIFILLVSILGIFNIIENSLLYMLIYLLEKIVSSVLLFRASMYTAKGQILKYSIDSYKIKLENQEFLTNKSVMEEIVKKKEFANSIALHINTQAKKAFIDDKMIRDATKISKKTITNIIIILMIIILVGLIMSRITRLLSPEGIFWLYVILTIAIACVADITLYKKK